MSIGQQVPNLTYQIYHLNAHTYHLNDKSWSFPLSFVAPASVVKFTVPAMSKPNRSVLTDKDNPLPLSATRWLTGCGSSFSGKWHNISFAKANSFLGPPRRALLVQCQANLTPWAHNLLFCIGFFLTGEVTHTQARINTLTRKLRQHTPLADNPFCSIDSLPVYTPWSGTISGGHKKSRQTQGRYKVYIPFKANWGKQLKEETNKIHVSIINWNIYDNDHLKTC